MNQVSHTGIEFDNLSIRYGAKTVVRDVSMHAPAGQITAMIGPSGCGKSSLLTCVNRLCELVPGCTATGDLRVEGQDVFDPRLDVVAHRCNVGMIFQRPNPFPMSIRRNIEMPLREHGMTKREERDQTVRAVLTSVGLFDEVCDRLDAPAETLSGGQLQRLCIARALALNPRVLLFDEPCSALDPMSSACVEDLIHSLRKDYTILIVTHNLAQAQRIADHIAFFWVEDSVGALIEFGETDQIFNSPREALTRSYIQGARG